MPRTFLFFNFMYSFLPTYFGRLIIYEATLPKNATESGFLKTNEKKTSPMYLLTLLSLGVFVVKLKKVTEILKGALISMRKI